MRLTPAAACSSSASVKSTPSICSAHFSTSLPNFGGAPPPRCARAGEGTATEAATAAGYCLDEPSSSDVLHGLLDRVVSGFSRTFSSHKADKIPKMPVTQKPAADEALAALIRGAQNDPFAVLGPHADQKGGFMVRAFQPAARSKSSSAWSPRGELVPMRKTDPAGVFEVRLKPDTTNDATDDKDAGAVPVVSGFSRTGVAPDYRLKITYPGDEAIEMDDPYRYGRVLTDFDLHLFSEGTPLPRLREAWRAPHRAGRGHRRAFRGVGAQRGSRQRNRRLQRLGRPRHADALS